MLNGFVFDDAAYSFSSRAYIIYYIGVGAFGLFKM